MTQGIIQIIVSLLVVTLAGVKSVRFAPSAVTEFELRRRSEAGDADAKSEIYFRQSQPLIEALRHVIMLFLTIAVVVALVLGYNVILATIFALVWLLLAELVSGHKWFALRAQYVAIKYRARVIRVAEVLTPVLRLMTDAGIASDNQAAFYSKQELLGQVQQDAIVLNAEEKLLIKQALSYKDRTVKDIMTPRSVIVTVQADDTIGPVLLDKLHKSGHSRFPVTDGDIDKTKGILYLHSLVPLDPSIKKVSDIMSERVRYVHQDKPLDHVLQAFLRTKCHLFMVVNEFEEVTGVISIEDVLEALIGRKIVDEFDRYEDLRAVAKLVAAERRKTRKA